MYALATCIVIMLLNLTSANAAPMVVGSSWQEPHRPANTIDGNVQTRWSAVGDIQNRVPATLWYDIGQTETVNLIRIAWQDSVKRANYFDIYASLDNQEWVKVTGGATGDSARGITTRNGVVWETYTFSEMVVRYIRIEGFGNSSRYNQWVSICEVEVGYDEGIITDDEIFISSTGWDSIHIPWNVTDNDYTSRWSNFLEPWLQLDLWESKTITAVRVAWHEGTTRKYSFDIEVSDDEQNWELVYEGQSAGNTSQLETYTLGVPVIARYIRLTGYGNSSKCVKCSKWTSILEMRTDTTDAVSGSLSGVGSTR